MCVYECARGRHYTTTIQQPIQQTIQQLYNNLYNNHFLSGFRALALQKKNLNSVFYFISFQFSMQPLQNITESDCCIGCCLGCCIGCCIVVVYVAVCDALWHGHEASRPCSQGVRTNHKLPAAREGSQTRPAECGRRRLGRPESTEAPTDQGGQGEAGTQTARPLWACPRQSRGETPVSKRQARAPAAPPRLNVARA